MKKIYIKENKIPLLEYYNSPDNIYLDDDDEVIDFEERDAIPFIVLNDLEILVGEYGKSHFFIKMKMEDKGDERDIVAEGRVWRYRNIISFWYSEKLNVNLINHTVFELFGMDLIELDDSLKIAYKGDLMSYNDFLVKTEKESDKTMEQFEKGLYDKTDYYDDEDDEDTNDIEDNIKNIHLMKQQDKRNALSDYRKNKETKLGKQLSTYDEYGNFKSEMTMAQWRALHSTSENKNYNKKVYINENQMPLLEWGGSSISKDDIERAYSLRYEVSEPDEEDYDEEEREKFESFEEFYNDWVTYDFEFYDIDDENIGHLYSISQWELDDYFDDDELIQNIINKNGRKIGDNEYIIDDLIDTKIDINNPSQADYMAKLLFNCHENYYKGLGGYILRDGTLVDFGDATDHNSISSIDGMTVGGFMNLGNIRIRHNNIDLVREPTYAQENILKKLINSYSDDEVYVDICTYKDGDWYASPVTSAKYSYPDYNCVLGEINRYFSEGIKLMGGHDMYESRKISENINFEVSPNEVDLTSFKKEKHLNKKIWDEDLQINSRVRLKLLDIADDFYNSLNIKWVKPTDIILTGSICNYNWSDYSDIDLHIIVDFSKVNENKELVKEYFDSKKNDWNNEHKDLNMFGFDVELYVQDINEKGISSGVYSLEKNTWISKPDKDSIKPIDNKKEKIKLISSSFMTKIDDLFDEFNNTTDKHIMDEIMNKCDDLQGEIRNLRSDSLKRYGESSIGNICYKVLRRFGYLDRLWELKVNLYDKINSIN